MERSLERVHDQFEFGCAEDSAKAGVEENSYSPDSRSQTAAFSVIFRKRIPEIDQADRPLVFTDDLSAAGIYAVAVVFGGIEMCQLNFPLSIFQSLEMEP